MIGELAAARRFLSRPAETVFAGGGTPTMLAPPLLEDLLTALGPHLAGGCEFTAEANPETVTPYLVRVLRTGGVNRLSIGAQSFRPEHLAVLERVHDPARVARSVELARRAGIENVNLDLIFAIPGQSLRDWQEDLDRALALEPDHLSCYALSYEPGTPLAVRLGRGEVRRAAPSLEADLYEATIDRLGAAGFEHYEISNWARPGRRCRHNMACWTNRQWWPLGPGASGHAGGWRWKNATHLGTYLRHGPLPPIVEAERLSEDRRVGEELMLRIRLVDGLERGLLDRLLGRGTRGAERGAALRAHVEAGLIEESAAGIRLSRRGLLFADTVAAELL